MVITPGILIYLFICYIIAFFARNRKFGFWIYFMLNCIFTPLIGFIIALASDKRVAAPAAAAAPAPTTVPPSAA